jgi:hypothetical protein
MKLTTVHLRFILTFCMTVNYVRGMHTTHCVCYVQVSSDDVML